MPVSFYNDIYPRVRQALDGPGLDARAAQDIVDLAGRVQPGHEQATESQLRALRNTTSDDGVRAVFDRFLAGGASAPAALKTVSQRAAGAARAPNAMSPVGAASSAAIAKQLVAMGYSAGVADRIALRLPDLARRILSTPPDDAFVREVRTQDPVPLMNFGPMDGRPVKVYRGVCVSPQRFDANFADTRMPGLQFYSAEITEPHKYASGQALNARDAALGRGEAQGTIIEAELPAFLLYFYGHPVARTDELVDAAIFISRRAAVDLQQPYFPALDVAQIDWSDEG